MARFFVPAENIDPDRGEILIKGTDCHHLKNVLRKKPGDELSLCGSDGSTYSCKILSFGRDAAVCEILGVSEGSCEPLVPVVLFQGVPKGDRMELIIQKCVELGVSSIVPVITEHTVVKLADARDREHKQNRWQKISAEAAKQSGRNIVPPVGEVTGFSGIFEAVPEGWLKVIPYENEETLSLKECLRGSLEGAGSQGAAPRTGNGADSKGAGSEESAALRSGSGGSAEPDGRGPAGIAFIIGPEGGFSEAEVKAAAANGFIPVTLGKRILRTETAGIAVLAAIRYELGD